jgi:flagellin-specific chaperone FliS
MTPKEKADEIYKRMLFWLDESEPGTVDIISISSINCALIAVDEIINTLNNDIKDINVVGNVLLDLIEYWEQVKQEISNRL